MEIKTVLRELEQSARVSLKKPHGLVTGFFVVLESEKEAEGVFAPLSDVKDRYHFIYHVGQAAQEMAVQKGKRVEIVGSIFESWLAIEDKKELESGKALVMPRDNPNRKEVVTIFAMNRAGKCEMKIFEYANEEKNDLKEFSPSVLREKPNEEPIEIESPLLSNFWRGVYGLKE